MALEIKVSILAVKCWKPDATYGIALHFSRSYDYFSAYFQISSYRGSGSRNKPTTRAIYDEGIIGKRDV